MMRGRGESSAMEWGGSERRRAAMRRCAELKCKGGDERKRWRRFSLDPPQIQRPSQSKTFSIKDLLNLFAVPSPHLLGGTYVGGKAGGG
jgi:hypothetical protein